MEMLQGAQAMLPRKPQICHNIILVKVFLVLFTPITVFISLKTVVVDHRVEEASLRAVLMLRVAWWLETYSTFNYSTEESFHILSNYLFINHPIFRRFII
jgi:hypothetical protein